MCILLYNRSIIKYKKRVKSCGKVYSSLYRVYNKRVYKGKQRRGKKGKERWRERVFPYIVYNSIIEIGEKKKGGTKICSLYIDI